MSPVGSNDSEAALDTGSIAQQVFLQQQRYRAKYVDLTALSEVALVVPEERGRSALTFGQARFPRSGRKTEQCLRRFTPLGIIDGRYQPRKELVEGR